ncbi:SAVED domain-containing protein [Rhizobium sp. X9]|uniref:SAVED domain-containing protein n=1 Tax=Rhizobium sp. X9 TaxID=2815360 RepID=UPI00209B0E13|nr:SAVED domain-containing protein [Rhizobium sp. X9]
MLTPSPPGGKSLCRLKPETRDTRLYRALKTVKATPPEQVHLVLAAQNSVVFNLARRYDKRNLPRVAVYQFERSQERRYPWGIEMPVAGVNVAHVIQTDEGAARFPERT